MEEKKERKTYDAAKRQEGDDDGEEVTGLEEIDGLEGLLGGDSELEKEVDYLKDCLD